MNDQIALGQALSGPPHGVERPSLIQSQIGARSTVRRSFLLLLVLALLPLLALGVGRSVMQLQRNQAMVEARLSEQALTTARMEAEVVTTARAIVTLMADNADVLSGGLLCDITLGRVAEGFAAFSNFSRFRADGSIACSSTHPLPDASVTGQPWWAAAPKTKGFFVSGPHWGTMSNRKVLVGVLPVHTSGGDFDGVITASIDMGWIERTLQGRNLGDGAVALILDGAGRPLLSNRPVDFGTVDLQLGPRKLGGLTDGDGRRWTYAVAPLVSSFDGKQTLHIAYAMPHTQLFSWTWWQAGLSVAQPLIAVLLVSLAIWFGTNRLVLRWLHELRRLANAYSAGNYRVRRADFRQAPSEFRDLAAALYKMGDSIDRRDTELRSSLEQQKLLVQEIHHRVKNNLQIVMSLLSLQNEKLEAGDAYEAIARTKLRISTLALVHRILYETGEETTVSSARLLGEVAVLLSKEFRGHTHVAMDFAFDGCEIDLDSAIPLSLWLVEAASNAWLHGFPDERNGKIRISLACHETEAHLRVEDDGVSFVPDPDRKSQSRGLRLLNGMAKQLGGVTEVTSTPGEGTTIVLRYPLSTHTRRALPA